MDTPELTRGGPWPGRLLTAAAALLLLACVALGGGTRQALPFESLLQILALPILLLALFVRTEVALDLDSRLCIALIAAVSALLLLQLLPLPPQLWAVLPGRQALADELAAAGVGVGMRPLSLDPAATLRALLAWLPPVALFLLVRKLDLAQRILLLQCVLALGVAACLLGFAQLAGGSESPLRWHEVTSSTNAVGPFANRNHLAALLAVCLPLSAAWLMVSYRYQRPGRRTALLMLSFFLGVLLVVALSVTRSRAGVLLGVAAFFGIAAMAWLYRRRLDERDRRDRRLKRLLMLSAAIGLAISMQYGLLDLWSRLRSDPLEDQRWVTATNTVEAIRTFGLLGTGAGTFVDAYASVEKPTQRVEYYVNRAHNDWLEWTLEGGLPAVALILCSLGVLGRLLLDAVRSTSRRAPWRWASAIGIGLLLLHSLIDYPLRTTALAAVAALLIACLLPDAAADRGVRTPVDRPPPRQRPPRRTAVVDRELEDQFLKPLPVPPEPRTPLPDDDDWGSPKPPSPAPDRTRQDP